MEDKFRVFEIAEEAGSTSAEVIKKSADLGFVLKSPQSSVSFKDAEEITGYLMTGKSNLLQKSKNASKRIMKKWFLEKYGKADDLLPHNKNNNSYVTLFGNLVDPLNILRDKYFDTFEDLYIQDVANKLKSLTEYWSPLPNLSDYEYSQISNIDDVSTIIDVFNNSIKSIENIINTSYPQHEIQQYMNYMVFANIFTVMETLLSDIFYFYIKEDSKYQRRFIEYYDIFKSETISISEIYKFQENILEKILTKLNTIVWHKFETVIKLYDKVLDVTLNLGYFFSKRGIRHDIIHRNGKKLTNGNNLEFNKITNEDVKETLTEVIKIRDILVESLDINRTKKEGCSVVSKIKYIPELAENLCNSQMEGLNEQQSKHLNNNQHQTYSSRTKYRPPRKINT